MGDSVDQSTTGKVISCKAALLLTPGGKLEIKQIDVAPPQAGEVRIKITHTSICRSDLFLWRIQGLNHLLPRILGHEAVGIVESVGEGVMNLKPGDHVFPLFIGECNECAGCNSNKTNLCEKFNVDALRGTMMVDGKSRFSLDGQPVFRGFSATFTEYTVLESGYVVKINPMAPLSKILPLSCGAATGLGSVWKVAKVEAGSTVAIFGLGTVGLAIAEGARVAGASRIIGVDTNSAKSAEGRSFGITDFLNPNDLGKPVDQVIQEMTKGGVDYAFESVGNSKVMKAAFDSCRQGWGLTTVVGVAPRGETMDLEPDALLRGKSVVGCLYGGWKPKSDVPELVEKYLRNEFELDRLITHSLPFSEINEAIQLLVDGKSLRTLLHL